ncbi:hypothetical protein GCM10009530_47970 [Microbispora corallina]|uniref:Uncharacterized protein n=1 Tax=Microbispora corallina TaxID=83302 RepID=A0ABQ4G5L2_9ACTN|nr:hypothetical protein [Microbispora corallina]GIH42372.1 hypothetical protein Mco01_53720 [Microbispora corallina]
MTVEELTGAEVRVDQDVFALRRLGREIADLVGLEPQGQIRMAAALSEIGGEVLSVLSKQGLRRDHLLEAVCDAVAAGMGGAPADRDGGVGGADA